MRHHYWEWQIACYLFLGGLGGGILALAAILQFFVYPGIAVVSEVMALPCIIALIAIAIGLCLLVIELGQPLVFYRAFVRSTSVICWGARILTVTFIFGIIFALSYIPWAWFAPIANFLVPFRDFSLAISGFTGALVVLYTGIFLSTLKAHAFWATPALPVLFTISAFSTACAAISLSVGGWPAGLDLAFYSQEYLLYYAAIEAIHEIVHIVDVVLVVCEVVVLLVMTLSFLCAGNPAAKKAAAKWLKGSYAGFFWVGMMGLGLIIPELLYVFAPETIGGLVIAPILVLAAGCLLRFLIIFTDERLALPGEELFYSKLPSNDALFIHKWTKGQNIY
jgi:polysulfide reductase chain C